MNITISDGTTTVTMPELKNDNTIATKSVTDAGVLVYKETTMASGRVVRKIIGFRPGFKYIWDYVPTATITTLNTMIRTGGFYTVTYFDTDGTAKSGTFSISYPAPVLFGYIDGIAVFHDFELTITAQEVI
jgi:hypothetical protein